MAGAELYAGLMSGTSLDGVDAVLVEISETKIRMLGSHHVPYPGPIRTETLALHERSHNELHRAALLGNQLASLYAETIASLLTGTGTPREAIRAVGCHGQTVRHRPELGYTLQINNPALLAELTGITTVADFRPRDVAAGGQGAPLVPAFHDAMFRSAGSHRIILNLGGIANITDLKPGAATRGFDCGPANILLDGWAQLHLGKPYDANGDWARSGHPIPRLLSSLLSHPFFAATPPKSCGREEFNLAWVKQLLRGDEAAADVQATLLTLTAQSITGAITRWCGDPDEIYLCGGGAYNRALVDELCQALPNTKIGTTAILGAAPELVEASAFAWLAYRAMNGLAGNLPSVTGATGERILGAIYQA